MINDHKKSKIDPFTAKASAIILVAIAVGFVLLSLNALATGCIRLKTSPHGSGLPYCKPSEPYWVATISILALGLALFFISGKLVRFAGKRSHLPHEEW